MASLTVDINYLDANFNESKHPRDKSGKFGSGGGGKTGVKEKLTAQQRGMADDALRRAKEQGAAITKRGDIILYHGTNIARAPKPGAKLRVGTYFTTSESVARQYASQGVGDKPIVMKVVVPPHKVFAGKGEGSYWTLNEETPLVTDFYKPRRGKKIVGKP